MTDLPPRSRDGAEDARLLERARAGDSDAFGELYRREVDPARRLARILVGEQGAEELVAESFARVLTQLQAGRGPTEDFRAYLQVTIRNGFRDGLRATKESPSSDQPWLLDDVLPPVEELVEDLDRDVAVTALATLPKSWQQVLWHIEVEGRKPAEVAGLLDMDAGAVSSLAYRAREGLKRAYLDQQFQPAKGGQCGWTQARLSQYVRGDLSARAQQKVADHVDECSACAAALLAVDRVNRKLAAWLFPVVLWGIAGSSKGGLLWFAGAAGAGGAGATGTPTSGPPGSPSGSGPNPLVLGAAGAAVACGIAASVALAISAGNGDDPRDSTSADGSAATQEPPPGDPGGSGDPGGPGGRTPTDQPPSDPPPTYEPNPVVAPLPTDARSTAVPTEPPTTTASDPDGPTTEPTDPTTDDPTTEPPLIEVVPEAPTVVAIDECGTYGSIETADTEGVSYAVTVADPARPEGAWSVTATAEDDYVVADGAQTRFSGNLGAFYPCVRLTDVEVTRHGPPLITPWAFEATLAVEGPTAATIEVVFDFSAPVFLLGESGSGWSCDGVLDPFVILGRPVTCTFDYTGAQPAPVEVDALALVPSPSSNPPGTVTVKSNGEVVDQGSF
jgi:RNA polymerase sigma factor (sigma-70 family)